MKHCLTCKQPKPLEEFAYIPSKMNYHPYCKPCERIKRKERYWANREKELALNAEWQRNNKEQRAKSVRMHAIGIPLDYYDELLAGQGNKCAICKVDRQYLDRNLAVDHDHSNDEVRGLLCTRCNTGLGYFYDNIEVMKDAIQYLINHRDKPDSERVKLQRKV